MISKKRKIGIVVVLAVFVVAALGSVFVCQQASNERSKLGRILRSWKGEDFFDQKVNDLAEDFRHIPEMVQLQPWALDTMARCRTGDVQGDRGTYLWWSTNNFRLAPKEMPEFIRKYWAETNGSDVMPKIDLVLTAGHPDYIVIHWYEWGIAVGAPEYRLNFKPEGKIEVKPGVYTYFFVK